MPTVTGQGIPSERDALVLALRAAPVKLFWTIPRRAW
jgi:hypothetical protein